MHVAYGSKTCLQIVQTSPAAISMIVYALMTEGDDPLEPPARSAYRSSQTSPAAISMIVYAMARAPSLMARSPLSVMVAAANSY